ncbi:MAG TPA: hypothetical protein VGR78_07445 [Verrucomicrobiae bacterium]|jgi:hypothetical protein|nr:hypothetical protein [Verrucomicrobiae bacterium]
MRYLAMMLSVPADRDLLNATNWIFSQTATHDPKWLDGKFNAWLEGNAVLAPDRQIVDILRVDLPTGPENRSDRSPSSRSVDSIN